MQSVNAPMMSGVANAIEKCQVGCMDEIMLQAIFGSSSEKARKAGKARKLGILGKLRVSENAEPLFRPPGLRAHMSRSAVLAKSWASR